MIDYLHDFVAFRRDLCPVEGDWGPTPIIPDWLECWYRLVFPLPAGDPASSTIIDCRSKKEGKSSDAAAVCLYFATRELYSQVVIVAADKDQAKDRVLRAAKFSIEHGPLREHARIFKSMIEFDNGSTIEALPADWQGAAGGDYSCIVFDELHTYIHESQRKLFDELIVPPTRPRGVRWIASYAGWLGQSILLKEWWDLALSGDSVQNDEGLPIYKQDDASLLALIDTGSESWRMPWMTDEYIKTVRKTERVNSFRRLWLNEWVTSEDIFIEDHRWEACFDPDVRPLGVIDTRRMTIGLDASTSRDDTAAVGCWLNSDTDRVEVVYVRTWRPERGELRGGKPTVDLSAVRDEMLRLAGQGNVDAIVYDPFQLHAIATDLERAGITMIEMPQTSARTAADQALYDAIIGRRVAHYGDPTLTDHLMSAVAVHSPRGARIAKERTSAKIDAAVALSMAAYTTVETRVRVGSWDDVADLGHVNREDSPWR